jgi:5-methylcytosine-specific restriction endonuclease McrBC GTP-binding regulatory subunit McrB
MTYQEFEKEVFDWLMAKHKKQPDFTFSLRQKGSKGAELDYFIGTENSNYFGTSFWNIPIAAPGRASDLIDVFFKYKSENLFSYDFEFNQTKKPHDNQNKVALELIREIKSKVKDAIGLSFESSLDRKQECYKTKSPKPEYTNIKEMLVDFEKDFEKLYPIVNNGLDEIKRKNNKFIGHVITQKEFDDLQIKLKNRLIKYGDSEDTLVIPKYPKGSFKDIIEQVKKSFESNSETKNRFTFNKSYHNYVWIGDSYDLIGSLLAHYEVSYNERKNLYFVDIHFEGKLQKEKDQFSQIIEKLPVRLKAIKWYKAKSIRHGEGIQADNENLVSEIKSQLLDLENTLGNEIRKILDNRWSFKNISTTNKMIPLNQILFGPPGTGKTYTCINKAISIIEGKEEFELEEESRAELKARFDKYMIDGQIRFTTFHQSLGYEDFIEGIKPITIDNEVVYEVKSGIFKQLCERIQFENISTSNFDEVYGLLLKEIKSKPGGKLILETTVHSKEFTIYVNSKNNLKFHPNTDKAYEGVIKKDVIEHYLKTDIALDWSSYTKAVGAFLKSEFKYTEKKKKEAKNFVLIIDEINRGNVSQIFGELITLLEDDKRIDKEESLELILPYSKQKFGVPSNLYIIGTMNTADRSVEALDAALRRRFSFEEMPSRPELISQLETIRRFWNKNDGEYFGKIEVYNRYEEEIRVLLGMIVKDEKAYITYGNNEDNLFTKEEFEQKLGNVIEFNGLDLSEILSTINRRLEKLIDKDHHIGHSYFMSVFSIRELKSVFKNKIIPLMQEYFFGDYGKIELVLGKGFFIPETRAETQYFAASNYDPSDFADRTIYKFKAIDEMNDNDFKSAITLLLNK